MKLIAYADESGTGGESEVLIVAGWVALSDEWVKFCKDWQRVLNKYSAKYFHFREWAEASAVVRNKRNPNSKFSRNPYKDWDQGTLDRFLFELAEVAASDRKLVIGGYVPHNMLRENQANGTFNSKACAEELCVRHFFDSVVSIISQERPVLKRQSISVFFDYSVNQKWLDTVHGGYRSSCDKHRQYKAIAFPSKGLRERVAEGDVQFLPLQAADMVAYRVRQRLEKLVTFDFEGPDWHKLDDILFKSINESKLASNKEWLDAALRRVFIVPEDVTYAEAIQSIKSSGRR